MGCLCFFPRQHFRRIGGQPRSDGDVGHGGGRCSSDTYDPPRENGSVEASGIPDTVPSKESGFEGDVCERSGLSAVCERGCLESLIGRHIGSTLVAIVAQLDKVQRPRQILRGTSGELSGRTGRSASERKQGMQVAGTSVRPCIRALALWRAGQCLPMCVRGQSGCEHGWT